MILSTKSSSFIISALTYSALTSTPFASPMNNPRSGSNTANGRPIDDNGHNISLDLGNIPPLKLYINPTTSSFPTSIEGKDIQSSPNAVIADTTVPLNSEMIINWTNIKPLSHLDASAAGTAAAEEEVVRDVVISSVVHFPGRALIGEVLLVDLTGAFAPGDNVECVFFVDRDDDDDDDDNSEGDIDNDTGMSKLNAGPIFAPGKMAGVHEVVDGIKCSGVISSFRFADGSDESDDIGETAAGGSSSVNSVLFAEEGSIRDSIPWDHEDGIWELTGELEHEAGAGAGAGDVDANANADADEGEDGEEFDVSFDDGS